MTIDVTEGDSSEEPLQTLELLVVRKENNWQSPFPGTQKKMEMTVYNITIVCETEGKQLEETGSNIVIVNKKHRSRQLFQMSFIV